MNDTALELYIYMCSHEEVIKHLLSEGVETKERALSYLRPYVKSNVISVVMSEGGCLSGTDACIKHVIKYFEEKEKTGTFEKAKNFAKKLATKISVDDYKELAKIGVASFIQQFGYPKNEIDKLNEYELKKIHNIIIEEGL
jgi:hypothetical protein